MPLLLWFGLLLPAQEAPPPTEAVLVETEALDELGGWFLDTQFTFEMGSSYLLAHGLGRPVADARGRVELPRAGAWRVWVRTKDWVARWGAPGAPGRFAVAIDGKRLETTFGDRLANWGWRDGGVVTLEQAQAEISLIDLTGFEGRCDALLFTAPDAPPPPTAPTRAWRDQLLGNTPELIHDGYDLVVVGGGYAGMGAALSAARMGAKVAL
ncbi:MAG: FAD-dependent oxidoreductase, partial [Planctomycetes bacterium]|nr:FAD-dependent oxidoreductase [Planctomycetota bacterium]